MEYKSKYKMKFSGPLREREGFTLIEVLLATAISALVMVILSACLSFALRAWEETQDHKPDLSAAVADLLKRQLAEFDPTPIKFEEGAHPFFSGQGQSLSFATSHSVKAISGGVPVIARYVYNPTTKAVYYAEIPLNPYEPETIKDFVKMGISTDARSSIRFYAVELADFELSYSGEGNSQYSDKWDQKDEFPLSVIMRWKTPDSGEFSQAFSVNSPFSIEIKPKLSTGTMGTR